MNLEAMALTDLAAAVRDGSLSYEAVALEWARRRAAGLDCITGRPPAPASASAATVAAIRCHCCGALTQAPLQPEGATK